MNFKNYLLGFAAMTLMVGVGTAQTKQQRQNITKDYNHQELQSLSQEYGNTFKKQRQQALEYAEANNLPTIITRENGEKSYLQRMDEQGNLIYYKTNSIDGAITIGVDRVWPGGDLNLELEGEGMLGAVWDGGIARETHELLEGKVTFGDNSSSYEDHGTHVAGVMVGKILTSGQGANARGMANKADVVSYDWYNDLPEMVEEAQEGLLVSNHSYGMDLYGMPNPTAYVGRYDDVSRAVDNLAYYAPYYTVVTAAGNDRGYYNPNPADNGYNILAGQMATAKNSIVVAAVDKVLEYNGPNSVQMAPFSSWGPTNDSRVKPDISANGMGVLSSYAFVPATGAPSDNAYAYESGTSMAAPSVAGGVLLIQELAADLNDDEFLSSAMVRALIIGTSRRADNQLGPNPRYGWGLMALDKVAELMLDAHNEGTSFYEELRLNNSNPTYSRNVTALGDELKVTIAWTDPAATVQGFNDDSSRLINDLDLRIRDTQGNTYYPWRLNTSAYSYASQRDGDNSVDNVEQVLVSNAVAGETYTIEVTYKDNLRSGKQDFAIVAMGTETLSVENHNFSEFSIYPNPAADEVNLRLDKSGEQVEVSVFDINGRKVLDTKFTGTSNFNERLDVSKLNSGIYFIKIYTDGKKATQKLIVK